MGVGSCVDFTDELTPTPLPTSAPAAPLAADAEVSVVDGLSPCGDVTDRATRMKGEGESGVRVRLPLAPLTDRGLRGRDSLRPLTVGQLRLVECLAWFGPVSDALLAALNGACGDWAASAVSIRRNVSDQRGWGHVGARDVLHGGAKVRFATASGRALVGFGEPVESWTDVEVSEHLLRLDAAVQVLGECRRVVSERQILASGSFGVEVDGELVVLGQSGWVPVLWAQGPGSRQGTAIFVLDGVESSTVVLKPVLSALFGNRSYSRVVLVVRDAVQAQRVEALIVGLGYRAVCVVTVVAGPRWLSLRA